MPGGGFSARHFSSSPPQLASPFQHAGSAPVHAPAVVPLVVLVAVAVGLTGIGAAGLRQRDIG